MTQLTSIDDLLEQMVALGASDLHVTVGSPPAYRIRGHIVRAEGFEPFAADDTRALSPFLATRYPALVRSPSLNISRRLRPAAMIS